MKKSMMLVLGLAMGFVAIAQKSIGGKVISQTGEPLIGATILLEGSTQGTTSDQDGIFQITSVPTSLSKLRVSYIGYEDMLIDLTSGDLNDLKVVMTEKVLTGESVFVYATRANEQTPTTFSSFEKEKLVERNLGQDLPQLLNFTPSMVTTSDAGAGIGYTGMRIRGSDGTRINVTINGVPVNDSESHGVFWVNMPDLASSIDNIQIQRGVGTSTNGAAAFGATVNLQTSRVATKAFAQLDNAVGSFGTMKNTLVLNSGLVRKHFNFEGRLSRIVSDGYIDRSASDLKSYFFSGGYYDDKTTIKALAFGGREVTQQAWYGTPQARLTGDMEALQAVIDWSGEYNTQAQIDNLLNSDRRFNYYLSDNEVDNYGQDHFQLHINRSLAEFLSASLSAHYTKGQGYFEQYRTDDDLADYNLADVIVGGNIISSTDLVRRRWLDNDFYGVIGSFNYNKKNLNLTIGGGWNTYDGDHFGEIIWSEIDLGSDRPEYYYEGVGTKKDANIYLKTSYQILSNLHLFGDAQFRWIDYKTIGVDNDLTNYDTGGEYQFFNPKGGLTYQVNSTAQIYGSIAVGQREPVRSDFIDALDGVVPQAEKLIDYEVGMRGAIGNHQYQLNGYYMDYENQLVLTGELNDVGSAVRTNVPDSYRMGLEVSSSISLLPTLTWNANLALSQNRIRQFTEVLYDYGDNAPSFIVSNIYDDAPISFSPAVVAGSDLSWSQYGFTIQFLSKYVSKQYLDNTGSEDRVIDAYFINDLRLGYEMSTNWAKRLGVNVMVNNLFNVMYSSNGYTWGYMFDGFEYRQNNYYPQAGTNFLAGLSLKF